MPLQATWSHVNSRPRKLCFVVQAISNVQGFWKVGGNVRTQRREVLLEIQQKTNYNKGHTRAVLKVFFIAAFCTFSCIPKGFFPQHTAISTQFHKEPFPKGFTLPHGAFQFHHTQTETERLWCKITKVQTSAPYEILASAPLSSSRALLEPLLIWGTSARAQAVRSCVTVISWSGLRGAGVMKPCLIGSPQAS